MLNTVCAGSASNVYLISFIPNYRAQIPDSILLATSDNTTITAMTKTTKETYLAKEGSLLQFTKTANVTIQPSAICTEVDVMMIGINKESGSIDAFLTSKLSSVLETSTYIIMTPDTESDNSLTNNFIIAAFYNNTEVTIITDSTVSYSTSGTWSSKSSSKYTLSNLDYISIAASVDLTGTEIHTSKPISVFSGHHCANIPFGVGLCDHVVEQIPPVSRWGTLFAVTTFQRNVPGDTVKIVASENNTEITVACLSDEVPKVLVQATINGKRHLSFQLPTNETCLINSSYPILAVQFSTGGKLSPTHLGDPSMSLIPHLHMYFTSGRAKFISPQLDGDISTLKHFVNIYIYYPTEVNITTATIDGVSLLHNENFQQVLVGQSLLPEGVEGSIYIFKGTVAGGLHVIEANGHVAATVYGYHTWQMYSYTVNY